jgi:hypothetical protein
MGRRASLFTLMDEANSPRRGSGRPRSPGMGERLDLQATPQSGPASAGCGTRDVSRPRFESPDPDAVKQPTGIGCGASDVMPLGHR